MKTKKLRVLALILVALLVGWVIWLFSHTPEYVATATIRVYPAAQAAAPKAATPVAPAAQVELPKVAAVGVGNGTNDSKTQVSIAQAELKATNQDIARMMREQGVSAAERAYAPPDPLAKLRPMPEVVADWTPDPHEIQSRENEAQIYDNLATLTPTINAIGDKAIYYGKANSDGKPQRLAIFLKIDGKWYLQLDWSRE